MSSQMKIALLLVLLNVMSFSFYGLDKHRAKTGSRRFSERFLMTNAVYGVIGAMLAMHVFHHKSRKPLFRYGVPIIFVLEVVLALYITHMLYGWPF